MNFSNEWDTRYRGPSKPSIWPWSDLIGYVMRYARPTPNFKVLELGCGAGANIPFFQSLGVDYYGIEGSPAVVQGLWRRFPELKDKVVVADFTQGIPPGGDFDLIVDRSSLTHNSAAAIAGCLDLLLARLAPQGRLIGIDWFSTAHSEFHKGVEADDPFTRTGYEDGQFAGVGRVHFSDRPHLQELFRNFEMIVLEHKIIRREMPDDGMQFAAWNFAARKAG